MRYLFTAFLAAVLLVPSAASADVMTWQLRSFSKNQIEVAFYSQNRKTQWPGGGKVYVNKTFDVVKYPLTCVKGEKICYGAWVKGNAASHWGMGQGGTQKCTNCCYTCGGNTITQIHNLNER